MSVIYIRSKEQGAYKVLKNQYKNNIEEDKPFFFNFDYDEGGKIRIGNGKNFVLRRFFWCGSDFSLWGHNILIFNPIKKKIFMKYV
ncbi:hypothetical protein BpHYR1_041418 [Brachionus plicatilis]|uniref:Uncharacterized protein n=1 Tax=Brachionus plicatilis TaxID=10195 RepID=A0A3M7PWF0_BRAPC|nr:hypothetical protein BpHYR1_041418 [Brachionus plicatilis]